MLIVTKQLKLESRSFRFKVALYLSYLNIKFDDEIETESHRSIISNYPASYKVKLTSRLGFIYSQMSHLPRLVT